MEKRRLSKVGYQAQVDVDELPAETKLRYTIPDEHLQSEGKAPAQVGSCLGTPLLRKDWTTLAGAGRLGGRVTNEESLWGVIITMGIAGARAQMLIEADLECASPPASNG